MTIKLKLRKKAAKKEVMVATDKTISNIGLAIEGQTKRNIQGRGLIDTGFFWNSVFVLTPRTDTFGQTKSSGRYSGRKSSNAKRKRISRPGKPGSGQGLVGMAADYAMILEAQHHVLMDGARTVARQVGGLIVKV